MWTSAGSSIAFRCRALRRIDRCLVHSRAIGVLTNPPRGPSSHFRSAVRATLIGPAHANDLCRRTGLCPSDPLDSPEPTGECEHTKFSSSLSRSLLREASRTASPALRLQLGTASQWNDITAATAAHCSFSCVHFVLFLVLFSARSRRLSCARANIVPTVRQYPSVCVLRSTGELVQRRIELL